MEAENELEDVVEANRRFLAGGGTVVRIREPGGEAEGVMR